MRKINVKQLNAVKPIINRRKKKFYFRYYFPDLRRDKIRKFENTEEEARVLREQLE